MIKKTDEQHASNTISMVYCDFAERAYRIAPKTQKPLNDLKTNTRFVKKKKIPESVLSICGMFCDVS